MTKLSINKISIFSLAEWLLITFFIIFYFSDGIGKILFRTGADFHRYSAIIKGFFELLILLYSIATLNKPKLNTLIVVISLVSFFLIGQFFLYLKFTNLDFFENFNSLFKYLFPLILSMLIVDILNKGKSLGRFFKYYKKVLTLNSILIIGGFLFSIKVLQTYPGIHRFGYDGLIFAQNEASYIFIFAIATVYYRRYYLHEKEIFFWIIIIPSLIVATKAVYLFIVSLFLFHVVKKVSLKKVILFGGLFLLIGYFLFIKIINKIIINSYDVFIYMYNKGGLMNAVLSGRNSFVESKLQPLIFDYWSLPNFFLGGQDVKAHYIEMGLIDLFLFFGFFGFIIYLFMYYKLFSLIDFKKDFKIFFGLILLFIIATSGHFFESGIAGVHFIMFIIINRNQNK